MTTTKGNSGWRWVLVLASLFGVFALLYVLDATFTGYSWSDVGQHLAFMAVFPADRLGHRVAEGTSSPMKREPEGRTRMVLGVSLSRPTFSVLHGYVGAKAAICGILAPTHALGAPPTGPWPQRGHRSNAAWHG